MQTRGAMAILACLVAISFSSAVGETATPLGKTMQLLTGLSNKITKDAEVEEAAYKDFVAWCRGATQNTNFEIKTATAQKQKLEVKIDELSSIVIVSGSKIESVAADIASSEAELKNATQIRKRELSDFSASEGELVSTIDTLDRAMSILEREMQKNPASFAQVDGASAQTGAKDLVHVLSTIVDAAAFPSSDKQKLIALVQSKQSSESDDDDLGAPAASTYTTHSSNILDLLEDLRDKAEAELRDLRKSEVNAKHNYEMLAQSLNDQIGASKKEMDDEKTSKAEAEEGKAKAEGELSVTSKELATATKSLESAQGDCMQTAANHELSVKAREEELKALSEAIKYLDTTKAADSRAYAFVQAGSRSATAMKMMTHAQLAGSEVVAMVRRLAKQHHSSALMQLASRIAAVVKYGAASGQDPFAKVKDLISSLITQLEEQANSEASEKAYCDDEMAKTKAKKEEMAADLSKLTSKIDQASAKSAQLKEEVRELQAELAALTKEQAELDKVRQESHIAYVAEKTDLDQGMAGVRGAIGVLREYYASQDEGAASMLQDPAKFTAMMQQPKMPAMHSKAEGAGSSIIGILEVVETDIANQLSKAETQESDQQSDYEQIMQENKVSTASKQQDVKYKGKAAAALEKGMSDLSADKDTLSSEQSAVLEYDAKLKERCIAKPEAYEERKNRREAEIEGLKGALNVLQNEVALVQQRHRKNMRGSLELP